MYPIACFRCTSSKVSKRFSDSLVTMVNAFMVDRLVGQITLSALSQIINPYQIPYFASPTQNTSNPLNTLGFYRGSSAYPTCILPAETKKHSMTKGWPIDLIQLNLMLKKITTLKDFYGFFNLLGNLKFLSKVTMLVPKYLSMRKKGAISVKRYKE